ncbi:class I SAM-dependent methyltransferase [Alphaproteobacteria bacterium]|nr:class I SAM-dependent methyltransferase [Alphaproteobacteria bacterium]
MGMDTFSCHLLRELLLQKIDSQPSNRKPIRIASLGYQDIICTSEIIEKWFGKDAIDKLTIRPNSDRILAVHGRNALDVEIVPTMKSFFKLIGNVKVDIIDFQQYQGDEIVLDFGKAIPKKLENKYDIVIDGGTVEHIFNIAQAFHNITRMLKVGGACVSRYTN